MGSVKEMQCMAKRELVFFMGLVLQVTSVPFLFLSLLSIVVYAEQLC